jgi:hypothetical protein
MEANFKNKDTIAGQINGLDGNIGRLIDARYGQKIQKNLGKLSVDI